MAHPLLRSAMRGLATAGAVAFGLVLGASTWLRHKVHGRTAGEPVRAAPRDAAERQPRMSAEHFRNLVHNAPDVVLILEPDCTIGYASSSVERVLGYRVEDFVGSQVRDYLHPEDLERISGEFAGRRRPGAEAGALPEPVEFRMRHAAGYWRRLQATSLLEDLGTGGTAYYVRDVTEHRALEAELLRRASHDPLTGLANRALFMDRLGHALSRASRHGKAVAVLFLDLDNFKIINDSLGHEAGDQLLITVARRLQACLRPGDTAARLGGDEFTVLLEDAEDVGNAARVAERISKMLRAPITMSGHTLFVTASVGVASSGPGLNRAEDLLGAADDAMYRAKRKSKARYEVFGENMSAEERERLELEKELRRAAECGELEVYYQPVVSLEDGAVAGFEALLRWRRPGRGLILPAEFIAFLEKTGLVVPVGRRVLEEACRQAAAWREQHPENPPYVGVNLSTRQLGQPDLVEQVAEVLGETGLEPDALVLEVTESLLLEDTRPVDAAISGLEALGVRLAVDDFGTGYSSLSRLERLPSDILKIDRSFVHRLVRDTDDVAVILSALVGVARALGISTVAEGVETAEQAAVLRRMGCDMGQGFFFSEALPASAASEFLGGRNGSG